MYTQGKVQMDEIWYLKQMQNNCILNPRINILFYGLQNIGHVISIPIE